MNTQLRIDKARLAALNSTATVFYGRLACNLRDVIDKSIDTAATDGRVIRWNPDFVAKLTDAELLFVLLHETLHCAHGHLWRLPCDAIGNEAGDYEINATLRKIAGLVMPKGGLFDRAYENLTCEEILAKLRAKRPQPQPQPQQPQQAQAGNPAQDDGEGAGNPQPDKTPQKPQDGAGKAAQQADPGRSGGFTAPADADDDLDADVDDDADDAKTAKPDTLREVWDRALVQADLARRAMQGDLPGDMARRLDRLKADPLDWRAETADFLRATIADRADWSRQARRHATAPVLYPQRKRDAVGLVVFVRDTSGSIDGRLLAQFNDLIGNAIADLNVEALVLDADALVQAEHRLSAGDEVPQTAAGGGGTDFRPAFDRVADLLSSGELVAGVVYLTDLDGPQPDNVDVPTLWLSTTATVARTGRTVRVQA